MLFAEPTRYGAGVTLWGDPHDLQHLVDTIYHLADDDTLGENVSNFLLGLAYDVRHAFQGDRLEKEFGMDELDKATYRGVKILWPYFLVQVGLLRQAAGWKPTTDSQQADIYRLEGITQKALLDYDGTVGRECIELISITGNLPPDYLVEFISVKTREYIEFGRAGKTRFKRLPDLLKSLWWLGDEYKAFREQLEGIAKKMGCRPDELGDEREWPEFKW